MILTLTGFMGCGKSSIGRELSVLTGWRLVDLDGWIEAHEGRSVRTIFAEDGEQVFRHIEVESLRQVVSDNRIDSHKYETGCNDSCDVPETARGEVCGSSNPLILSLGGGTLTSPEAVQLVHSETYCIYLRAGVETLLYNLERWPGDRPMLADCPDRATLHRRIEELLSVRAATYERTAHIIVNIDRKEYGNVAKEIMGRFLQAESREGKT